MKYIIDTNVPLTANGVSSAGPACVLAASERILATQNQIIVLDDEFNIISEYQNKLSSSGQPGPGDAFLKWVLQNRANPLRCETIALNCNEDGSYSDFPDDEGLDKFDLSDRKFVALAIAHAGNPPIVNATDTDWYIHIEALERCGISVEFLCMSEMEKSKG
ncbi:hypothetical protein [Hymenobacter canadensis]|uniref:PIN domain-containing protein n=1 Tax=Hymenobacter canadensis TaxID=2999067 RepID=A0ABY7LJU2_9BACT|nr:hypothetical protein [Hymenobacter canadensis]WBA40699.1 hypothetical protein O3303_12795 [Hymenobacter canadensis]